MYALQIGFPSSTTTVVILWISKRCHTEDLRSVWHVVVRLKTKQTATQTRVAERDTHTHMCCRQRDTHTHVLQTETHTHTHVENKHLQMLKPKLDLLRDSNSILESNVFQTYYWSIQRVTYLKQIEVSVELGTFSVLQSFELPCDEHKNVLDMKKKTDVKMQYTHTHI